MRDVGPDAVAHALPARQANDWSGQRYDRACARMTMREKEELVQKSQIRKIAVIGTYMPRQCGVATFTTDFCEALSAQYPDTAICAIPVNDTSEGYPYPSRVEFEITESDIESYRQAADYLNINRVDLVVLQHEYGIFGGPSGSYILELLRELRMPVVTVLHTVLDEPDRTQHKVLAEVGRLSDRLVVMSHHALNVLNTRYQIPLEKVIYIPHGIPDVPFVDPNFYKDQFDAAGKVVLLTFGLLSPNKGIEHAIAAMPAILEHYPDALYFVLGATHPHVRRRDGEAYRLMLQRLARELGVEHAVVFFNQFVRLEKLVEFIGATDIYVTPYLNREQIVSGTLAYAVGTGKAVVSTPYWHAEELLDEGRGVIVPFRDSAAIAQQVIWLLDHDADRHAMRKRGYELGREMIWSQVAQRYMTLFDQVRDQRLLTPQAGNISRRPSRASSLPPLSLRHLQRMTDSTGLLQHATFSVPNYGEGYSIDDNARGLIATVILEELGLGSTEQVAVLAGRYLAYIAHACNKDAGRFRNFLSYDRHWLDDVGSEDSHGRTLWALGMVIGRSTDEGHVGLASLLFNRALPAVVAFTAPRAWSFALIGIHEYLKRFTSDRGAQRVRDDLADRLMQTLSSNRMQDWPWFEESLTYDNATLPRALLLAGADIENTEYTDAAINSLSWLMNLQFGEDGHFIPIGNQGFYHRGEERARFDQQPIEAYATIAACLTAFRETGDIHWHVQAQSVFDWFLGRNDLGVSLIDPATGACYDGLQPDWVNQNQGAESTLAFLLALLDLRAMEAELLAEEAARVAERLILAKEVSVHA
jgi:glycosyltransferase involved in cell wall biosynthesis